MNKNIVALFVTSRNYSRLLSRLPIFVLLALIMTGCSTSFAYNRLDWLIAWYANDYVELSSEQKGLLKTRLEPVLKWHRHEELLSYVDLLNKIETDIEHPLDTASVESWMTEARAATSRIENSLLKLMLDIGESLTDEQIAEFKASLTEKQEEYREEYLERSDEEYAEDNYKNLLKNLRRFTGSLNDHQKQVLRRTAKSMQRFDLPWLEDRENWLKQLSQLLTRKPGWKDAILQAHQQREANRSVQYKKIMEHNITTIAAGIAGVLNDINAKQALRLKKEIKKYRFKLSRLSDVDS